MKLIFTLIFFLIFSNICLSQSFTMNQGGTMTKNYYVELPYENINGKIVLTALIKNKPHRFLFDTGAPTALSEELARQIGAEAIHSTIARDVNGHADSISVIKLNDIKLGSITFSGVAAMRFLPALYKCWNVEGVIGSNLLRNSIVRIISTKHLIILTDQPDKLSLDKKYSTALITNEGNNVQSNPVLKVNLKNKVNVTIAFDTGDNGFLRLSDDYMSQLSKFGVYETIGKGYGASQIGGGGLQADAAKFRLKIPFLNIGSARFENVITETNRGTAPAFGTKLLEYGDVTLDFVNGKFYCDPYNEKVDLNEKFWPFEPIVTGQKLVVGLIWDNGVNMIKPGEQIIAVNDEIFSNVDLCDMLNRKPILADKNSAIITLKDSNAVERKVKIIKE